MTMKSRDFSFQPFSQKQLRLMYWWDKGSPYADCEMVIADGAVRSGKTIAMICGFFLWSLHSFSGEIFILAGKTIGALKKNVITPALQILHGWGLPYTYISSGTEMRLEVGGNVYYLYDACNEKSQDKLQGLTAAGALADEVALFPQSFVEQMLARCSVDGARLWLNCNPASPGHFVKTELIDKAAEKRIYRLHFRMDDNLALSPKKRAFYERMYSGAFYLRFVLGEWAMTDGLVYQQFADNPDRYITTVIPPIRQATIGVDFGGTGSAHSFTLTGFTPGYDRVIALDEFYHNNKADGVFSPADLEREFVAFVRRAKTHFRVYTVWCDSAEQTMIQGLRVAAAKAGLGVQIKNAIKGPINDRIAFFNSMISQERFLVHSSCQQTIKALREAVYDSKRQMEDVRLDDGTTNIDSLDSLEYSVEDVMSDIIYLGLRRTNT